MPITRSQWVADKVTTALCLYNGACGGGYNEAVIVLSSAISSIAAEIWPGENKDKKRFVELIKNFSDHRLNSMLISLPLLAQHLDDKTRTDESRLLRQRFINYSEYQVLRARDTDRTEMDVLKACPNISINVLRKHSYASIFYEEVRSRLVHEYKTGEKTDSWAVAATDEDEISYGNWSKDPLLDEPPIRRIHFPIHWLINVAKSVAESVDRNSPKLPLKDPQHWWLSGG